MDRWTVTAGTVTDAGLKVLKDRENLSILDLGGTSVTDAGLKELKNLKSLSTLSLWDTRVTDAGLKELNDLTVLNLCERCRNTGAEETKKPYRRSPWRHECDGRGPEGAQRTQQPDHA